MHKKRIRKKIGKRIKRKKDSISIAICSIRVAKGIMDTIGNPILYMVGYSSCVSANTDLAHQLLKTWSFHYRKHYGYPSHPSKSRELSRQINAIKDCEDVSERVRVAIMENVKGYGDSAHVV